MNKRVVVLMTSDIQNTYDTKNMQVAESSDGCKFYTTGVLEALKDSGEKIVVVSTRTKLDLDVDGWWINIVGKENIFLTPENDTQHLCVENPALLVPWRRLFEREGVVWPDNPGTWDMLREQLDDLSGGEIVCGVRLESSKDFYERLS